MYFMFLSNSMYAVKDIRQQVANHLLIPVGTGFHPIK